jgi:signal recognition particle subunit SRP54
MFNVISSKFSNAVAGLIYGKHSFTDEKLEELARNLRVTLLEADVSLPVVKKLIDELRGELIGKEVSKKVDAADYIMKCIYEKIIDLIGKNKAEINFNESVKPNVILMIGLQGAGKTTNTVKLARLLNQKFNRKVLVASVDIYRPAAQKQLEINAQKAEIPYLETIEGQKPLDITKRAIAVAKDGGYDYLIIDTAGRTNLDQNLMQELDDINNLSKPSENILVIDSLIGRESLNIIQNFNNRIKITGLIATRVDGDTRAGVILNAKSATGVDIKFLSNGEKLDDFEEFMPDRIAGLIIGMGDIKSVVEKIDKHIDKDEKTKMENKIKSGDLDFNDILTQLEMVGKMGGIEKLISFLPFAGKFKEMLDNNKDLANTTKQVAIIKSMTKKERANPNIVKNSSSRKKRITDGSGTKLVDINRLLKKLEETKLMTKKLLKGGGGMDNDSIMKAMQSEMEAAGGMDKMDFSKFKNLM